MARWAATQQNLTFVSVADTAAFTSAGFAAYQGASSTQRANLLEFNEFGLASASAVTANILARDSTVGATLSVGNFAALDPASAALAAVPVAFSTATTKPQRSSTLQLVNAGFNAFGGIFRWVAAPGEEIGILGSTASLGEISLSSLATGAPGAQTTGFIIEPF